MESYEIEQKLKDFKPEPNWNKFKVVKPNDTGRRKKPALVSITKTTIGFGKPMYDDEMVLKNVEIRIADPAQVMFIFKKEPDAYTYRVSSLHHNGHLTSAALVKKIAEQADLHTMLFRYKYQPSYYDLKKHVVVVNLADKPYSKVSVKEHKHD